MTLDVASIVEQSAAASHTGRQTVHSFVLESLRRSILDGHLVGGTCLIQAEIAEALCVSTTPVREALRDLATEGLVRIDAHRGGVVHELSLSELEEIYGLRILLEQEALRRAWPYLTDAIIDEVAELHERMHRVRTPSEWVELNCQFHGTVLNLARSPRLLSILDSLVSPWIMYVSAFLAADSGNQGKAVRGHDQILEALREHDLEATINALVNHLSISWRALESSLKAEASV